MLVTESVDRMLEYLVVGDNVLLRSSEHFLQAAMQIADLQLRSSVSNVTSDFRAIKRTKLVEDEGSGSGFIQMADGHEEELKFLFERVVGRELEILETLRRLCSCDEHVVGSDAEHEERVVRIHCRRDGAGTNAC